MRKAAGQAPGIPPVAGNGKLKPRIVVSEELKQTAETARRRSRSGPSSAAVLAILLFAAAAGGIYYVVKYRPDLLHKLNEKTAIHPPTPPVFRQGGGPARAPEDEPRISGQPPSLAEILPPRREGSRSALVVEEIRLGPETSPTGVVVGGGSILPPDDLRTVELHKATYYPLRADYPQLPAQLVISARAKATEAVKSAIAWKVKRERNYPKKVAKALARGKSVPAFKTVKCPQSTLNAIRYDQRSYTVYGDCISLATIQGRQILALHLYPYAIRLMEQSIGYDSADLICRKGKFWLHMAVTLPDVEFTPNGEIVGVDFGIVRPAVASNNRFFGQRRWKATERRYFRSKRALQSKGTKSAKRHLRKLSRKTARFRTNCDHVISRQLVQSVTPGTLIVIENLMEIRSTAQQRGKQQKRAMHQWSFNRLRDLLVYKAEAYGCRIVGLTHVTRLKVVLVVDMFIALIVFLNLVSGARNAVLNSMPTSTAVAILLRSTLPVLV